MGLYTRAVRPALFALDAERAHDLTLTVLRQPFIAGALKSLSRPAPDPRLHQVVLGRSFAHPIGLAAGLDKQGVALRAWEALGFAFVEIGTVTPKPQPGNPRPRLFRLREDDAIVNRFGFNSIGATGVAGHLRHGVPRGLLVGINVGRNKDTPNDRAPDDYVSSIEELHPFADYFVVNVSSPNTAGLRDLQESRALRALVERVVARVRAVSPAAPAPVLVKVSPDAPAADLLHSVDAALDGGAAGVVATNTTVSRTGLHARGALAAEAGGLSGAPLKEPANAVCRLLYRHLGGQVPIIGVGGIFSAADAYERIRSGASLIQIYTALIYRGPGVISELISGLARQLEEDGVSNIQEAIGADAQ